MSHIIFCDYCGVCYDAALPCKNDGTPLDTRSECPDCNFVNGAFGPQSAAIS